MNGLLLQWLQCRVLYWDELLQFELLVTAVQCNMWHNSFTLLFPLQQSALWPAVHLWMRAEWQPHCKHSCRRTLARYMCVCTIAQLSSVLLRELFICMLAIR